MGLVLTNAARAQFSCSTSQDDMLDWFTMRYPDRIDHHMAGNSNPSYTYMNPDNGGGGYADTGYFLWIKGVSGNPWDIKTWDRKFIYDRSTELWWKDPTSFKRFNQDLRLSPRCIPTGKAGPLLRTPSSGSTYQKYGKCKSTSTNRLGYVRTQISAPFTATLSVGPVPARRLTYMYDCDVNYANCTYKEVFGLAHGFGDYDWKYYKLTNGRYVFQKETILDQEVAGQTTPNLPCTNSYQ
jgi:hypothetical protein